MKFFSFSLFFSEIIFTDAVNVMNPAHMHVHVHVVMYMYVLTCTSVALLHEPSEAFMAHSTTNTLNDRIRCEVVTQKLICVCVCALIFGVIAHAVMFSNFFLT